MGIGVEVGAKIWYNIGRLLRKVKENMKKILIVMGILCAASFAGAMDGAALQAEIDRVAAAGGGRVVVPAGEHACASLRLASHVELHLEKGARLVGSTKSEDYFDFPLEVCGVTPEGSRKVFIYAWDAEDVAITGQGTIDGQGPAFFDQTKLQWRFWAKPSVPRPRMVQFVRCKNVRLEGVTFLNSPGWTMLLRQCENVKVKGISVEADARMINSDGIDFDGCRGVRVSNSKFHTGDDAIILRAMRMNEKERIVCEDVVVANCELVSACNGVRIGCPADDTIRNAVFRDCTFGGWNGVNFEYPRRYLPKSGRGGVVVKDITFERCVGTNEFAAVQIVVEDGVRIGEVDGIVFRDCDWRGAKPWRFLGTQESPLGSILLERVKSGSQEYETKYAPKLVTKTAALIPWPRAIRWGNGTLKANAPIERVVDQSLGEEAYCLSVTAHGVTLRASTDAGFFYAERTLAQLRLADGSIPLCEIEDAPAYKWRGFQLDVSRYFFTKDEILKLLEVAADYKLNVFHWHLTDDQGWRLESKKFPELTKIGAVRDSSSVTSPTFNGYRPGYSNGSEEQDGKVYGPYFYTYEDVKEVLARAKELHITVIPEIEFPGHVRAALAAYPEYSCKGAANLPRKVRTALGIEEEVLCVGNDEAIQFCKDVLDEVIALFPSQFIHIGGDECPKVRWEKCAKCQARKAAVGAKDEHALQAWFTRILAQHVSSRGRRAVGWDEVADGVEAAALPQDVVVMNWRGDRFGGAQAAARGHDVVMTPSDFLYLNYSQFSPEFERESKMYPHPSVFTREYVPTSLRLVYSFDPLRNVAAKDAHHILGAQVCMWANTVPTPEAAQWRLWPRSAAFAEVIWRGEKEGARDFDDFVRRLALRLDGLRQKGIHAAPLNEGKGFLPASASPRPWIESASARGYDWWARHVSIWKATKETNDCEVLFVGDEVTQDCGKLGEMFAPRKVINAGYGWERTQNALVRLRYGEIDETDAKWVVVELGGNNLRRTENYRGDSAAEVVEGIAAVVGEVRRAAPKAKVIVVGLFPQAGKEEEVKMANELLARQFVGEKDVTFVAAGEKWLEALKAIIR